MSFQGEGVEATKTIRRGGSGGAKKGLLWAAQKSKRMSPK